MRISTAVDKACSPLFVPKGDEVTDDEKLEDVRAEETEKVKDRKRKHKEGMDLRTELSRRKAERLTKVCYLAFTNIFFFLLSFKFFLQFC